jgi:hypothetical protein
VITLFEEEEFIGLDEEEELSEIEDIGHLNSEEWA